jgi:hypothetical protein
VLEFCAVVCFLLAELPVTGEPILWAHPNQLSVRQIGEQTP